MKPKQSFNLLDNNGIILLIVSTLVQSQISV